MSTGREVPGVVVRSAERQDLAALGRLGALLMQTHFAFDRDRFLEPGRDAAEGYAWFLGTQLDEPGSVVLVAEYTEQIVGYVYASIEPRSWKELRDECGYIHDVVVDETARGRGIASALLEAAAAWLFDRHVPRIVLLTAFPNLGAQRLFARLGFRPTMIEMTRERGERRP